MKNRIGGLFVLAALLTVAALAHHNMTALFDLNDRVTLKARLPRSIGEIRTSPLRLK